MSAPADPIEQCLYYLKDSIGVLGGPGNCLVDLGASRGDFLVPALEAGFKTAIAVEADKDFVTQLERRLAEKGLLTRVTVLHHFIGATNDKDYFRTIENIMSLAPEIVDLLKVDIEGHEYDAFMRAPQSWWMSRVKVMHLEQHNDEQEDRRLWAFLTAAGWRRETSIDDWCGCWVNTRFICPPPA